MVANTKETRLQLGTSRLEALDETARRVFLDKSWLHLGDVAPSRIRSLAKHILGRAPSLAAIDNMYRLTTFQSFTFADGDSMKFESNQFNFIYSEHFFEHLSLDLAQQMFRECYRLLTPGGVIRTCVPDADFRVYEPPEPTDFPARLPTDHPMKHKVRWSLQRLADSLRDAGFAVVPLTYCTADGHYISVPPQVEAYTGCIDSSIIMDTTYIMRKQSLIVDGIKR